MPSKRSGARALAHLLARQATSYYVSVGKVPVDKFGWGAGGCYQIVAGEAVPGEMIVNPERLTTTPSRGAGGRMYRAGITTSVPLPGTHKLTSGFAMRISS